jgi:hypothetical protein
LELGREKVESVDGSLRRAVMATGVLQVIIVFSGGMTYLVSSVSDGRI